jgi:photosystem II protein
MRMMAQPAEIQFLKGVDEMVVPDIKLTRSIDGMTGTATFIFDQPNFLQASSEPQGEITGMYMIDEEGEIATTDVNAKFLNGKPRIVEAVFIMRDPPTFDRVMRFLVRVRDVASLRVKAARVAATSIARSDPLALARRPCPPPPRLMQERYAESHGLAFNSA